MTAVEKIKALRTVMKARGVAALVIPSTDPHQSETVGPRWRSREWLSGFTGSSGTLVITHSLAGLWTDGRYFIQAAAELKGSGIRLFKMRGPGVPTVNEWIAGRLKPGESVAFDGHVVSVETVRGMEKAFSEKKLKLWCKEDLVSSVWADRPGYPCVPVYDFPVKFAGWSRARKLATVRATLREKNADALLLASLDDIAWLFNIRGRDIPHSPVVLAYALIEARKATLFVGVDKVPSVLRRAFHKAGVMLLPYESITSRLKALPAASSLLLNPRRVNYTMKAALPKTVRLIEETPDITTELKAVKNFVEQGHFRRAALVDGLALTRFFAWLDSSLAAGVTVTEYTAGLRLAAFRKEAPECRDDSFPAICASGPNAAMIHYSARAGTAALLRRHGLFLVDSGGNYFEGTMDTTRTVALGRVSEEARRGYTLVLKGLIALSRVRFPAGCTGTHLDALVRAPLWAHGLNYNHGSGHGVGAYLNVHEGPHGFTSAWNASAFKPGMVVTIEPGLYVQGRYGIRTENMALVTEAGTTIHGEFLRFETLTVCPIDTAPLIPGLLAADEKAWLNDYHRTVWNKLSPLLNQEERRWLKKKTAAI